MKTVFPVGIFEMNVIIW